MFSENRKPISFTQKHIAENGNVKDIQESAIAANPPIENIYHFEGVFKNQQGEDYKEALNLENTIWGSTVLATGKIQAIVLYTGEDMRVIMNSREPRSKVGRVDLEINRLSKLLFFVLASISLMLVGIRGFQKNWYIQFFRFIILLSYIVPISLRVNLDFAKLFYSYNISHDKEIEGCLARNRDIPEELGRIQFLLTDKTGTLTQNEMVFKKVILENGVIFTPEKREEALKCLVKSCEKYTGPLGDIEEKTRKSESHGSIPEEKTTTHHHHHRKTIKRDKESLLRDMITALAVCHNVTPVMEDGQRKLQASSPDEVALVEMAESFQIALKNRTQNCITIENAVQQAENYEILANFPFSSETKRMGIILKNTESGRIIFYLKGADTIMKDKVTNFDNYFLFISTRYLRINKIF